MARLAAKTRESLTPEAQAIWQKIAGPRGATEPRGPYGVLMHHPALAEHVGRLGEFLRFQGTLPGADRELAILATAREIGSHYEWVAHEPIGLREGTRKEAIDAVRAHGPLDGLTERERTIVELVRALYRHHAVSDDLFARAQKEFSTEQLLELAALAGHYGTVGYAMLTFQVEPPDGSPASF